MSSCAAGPENENNTSHNRTDGCNLRVAHAPVKPGIDANKLHQKARQATQGKIFSGYFTGGSQSFRFAASPEYPGNDKRCDQLINRRGMHALRRWDQAIGKAHSPWKAGRDAIITIAGDQTAETAYAISNGGGRSSQVQHSQFAQTGSAALP